MRLFGKKTVSEQFIKELKKKIGIYVYLFVILFSLGKKNEVLFKDYVKQFNNKNFYLNNESDAFNDYLKKEVESYCYFTNCMDVLTAKLERGEFMCKLDPKDLRESINCILEENKIKNKDYLNKNNAYYSDIYNDTQSFIISKLRSY
jgi:hypothetical protein